MTLKELKELYQTAMKNACNFEAKGRKKKAQKWLERAAKLEEEIKMKKARLKENYILLGSNWMSEKENK